MSDNSRLQKVVNLAMLIAIGLIIWILEEFIPRPLPFIKFGFANIISLLTLLLFGYREALIVTFMRILLANILLGRIGTPSLLVSMTAGMMSIGIIIVYFTLQDRLFSIIGLSIIGAFVHNIAQISVVFYMLSLKEQVFYLIPFLSISSIVTGGIVGLITAFLIKPLHNLRPVLH